MNVRRPQGGGIAFFDAGGIPRRRRHPSPRPAPQTRRLLPPPSASCDITRRLLRAQPRKPVASCRNQPRQAASRAGLSARHAAVSIPRRAQPRKPVASCRHRPPQATLRAGFAAPTPANPSPPAASSHPKRHHAPSSPRVMRPSGMRAPGGARRAASLLWRFRESIAGGSRLLAHRQRRGRSSRACWTCPPLTPGRFGKARRDLAGTGRPKDGRAPRPETPQRGGAALLRTIRVGGMTMRESASASKAETAAWPSRSKCWRTVVRGGV